MYAIITGASSGIGMEMAKQLGKTHDLILVARREDKLRVVQKELQHICQGKEILFLCKDISKEADCISLYEETKEKDIEVLINCAGCGVYGQFHKTSLQKELSMIQTNVVGLHILMKVFLKDMLQKNRGYIMNVASSAGYMPGSPFMASYYASKSYVVSLTRSVANEPSVKRSNVVVCVVCPGPVDTEFNRMAGIPSKAKGISAISCAKMALQGMFAGKEIIIPGFINKFTYLGKKVIPDAWLLLFARIFQEKKTRQ